MANTKLGEKHICFHCEKKFYDFGKSEVVCPSCGADQKSGVAPDPEAELEEKSEILEDELDDAEDFEDDDLAAGEEGDEDAEEDFEDEDLEGIAVLEDDEDFGGEDDDYDDEDDVDDF